MAQSKKTAAIQSDPKARVPKVTPIERIFGRLIGRKMNPVERRYFHIKPKAKLQAAFRPASFGTGRALPSANRTSVASTIGSTDATHAQHSFGSTSESRRPHLTRATSPIAEAGIKDRDSPYRKVLQQLPHARRHLAIARNNHGPFQIFPEFPRADAPTLQSGRRRLPNLDERPVPGKSQRRLSIRKRTSHNQMVVAHHQNTDHFGSILDSRIRNRAADRKMIDHLLRK